MENLSVPFVMEKRFVFHVDVNSAYLSWSAAYRTCILGEKKDLRAVPSVVGGDQEKRHGIVLAKSIPAKRFGIQTGEPLVSACRKCPDLIVIPPDYSLYVRASRALMKLLERYSDQIIPYSIDEAWVILEGFGRLYGREQMVNLAWQMKEEIRDRLGFTVNIGVSTNLLLAKMAGELSKPDRVHTLFEEEIEKKMWPLPVSELFMAGSAMSSRLGRLGIRTIGELARADSAFIRAQLKRPGEILRNYAGGGELESYVFAQEYPKGYGNSMTAVRDILTAECARHYLLSLCETVGARLRQGHVRVDTAGVHITTYEFQHFSRQRRLPGATNITEELYEAACSLFAGLWDGRTPIRQAKAVRRKGGSSDVRQILCGWECMEGNPQDCRRSRQLGAPDREGKYGRGKQGRCVPLLQSAGAPGPAEPSGSAENEMGLRGSRPEKRDYQCPFRDGEREASFLSGFRIPPLFDSGQKLL